VDVGLRERDAPATAGGTPAPQEGRTVESKTESALRLLGIRLCSKRVFDGLQTEPSVNANILDEGGTPGAEFASGRDARTTRIEHDGAGCGV
jgi:hypothetical protein